MLAYCGQTVGWIRMPLDTEVGSLGPGDIVLDGEPALPSKAHSPTIFGPCLLWPNGWMDQDATWFGGRHRPRRHYVRGGPSFRIKRSTAPTFRPMSIVAKRSLISDTDEHLLRVRRLAAFRRMLGTPRTKTDQRADYGEIIAFHLSLPTYGRSLNNDGPRRRAAASSRCMRISNYAIGLSNDRLQRSTKHSPATIKTFHSI